ncbi:terminase large subunit [Lysinibacillus sphaericus]|uniref:Terminase n=1 Tax=Lysinibacillus sphaericus TaxID=1421 RepID=A0AAJ5DF44_LYSSH|nr:terminase TerL endonuclease subunit [Lysinibacillus sphaericus]MED4546393.1 terminase large subunit [Lysinibacillus sphaericus]TKI18545.1 terminase large subunit [Lysinibacillus sphaericus]GEC84540.1 terminase [Lysinibacillus sphaericus]SUX55540.1 terminase [Lysinibacillus sphaericus]
MNYEEYIKNTLLDASFCPTTLYALKVIEKQIVTSEAVRMACERHLRNLKQSESAEYLYTFDRNKAAHIFNFVGRFIYHQKGEWAGQTIELELWQKFNYGSLMGWVRKDDGRRRFTLAYTQIARKNTKSTMSSALANYMFMIDKEPGAECYCASIKRDTAKIVWLDAMNMVKSSPVLKKHVRIQQSLSTMWYGNNVMKALSADSGQDGLNIHFFSLDEYHLMKDNAMFDVLVSAMGARRNPLGFIITTAGESRGGTSPCYLFYEYCKQVLRQDVDNENLFVFIAELDNEHEIHEPSAWVKANPNLGVSVKIESLEQAYNRAIDGHELDNFLIKHMNRWIARKDSYFPLDRWNEKPLPVLDGKECYIGVDLASKLDLNSVTAVFPLEDEVFAVLNHNFMPADSLAARERQDKVPYSRWAKEGFITLTPGDVVDVEFIFKYIQELAERFKVISIGFDPWNATALMTKTANAGFTTVEVRQGYKTLSEPTKFIKELMMKGKFVNGNNPVLKWATANCVAKYDSAENVLLDKSKSINRIDPMASTVIAMVEANLHGERTNLNEHILQKEYSIW